MTPEEILRGAAAVLREKGRSTGFYRNENSGCFCALGALAYAAGKRDGWHAVYTGTWLDVEDVEDAWDRACVKLAEAAGLPDQWHIVQWNDLSSTTDEDVIGAMERAAGGHAVRREE